MRTIMGGAIVLAVLHGGSWAPVAGQETPLTALLAEADRANPTIAGARSAAEAAAARVPQAGALPDPTLGLALMNVPVASPGLGNAEMTMAQVRVGAGLPWPGKLGLAERAARFQAEAAAWEVERARWDVRTRVEKTYYEIYFLDRAIEVTTKTETLLANLASLSTARYGLGAAVQADVLQAEAERIRVLDQLVALEQARESAAARLNALLARSSGERVATATLPERVQSAALAPAPDDLRFAATALGDMIPGVGAAVDTRGGMPPVADIQQMALATNPDLQVHTRRVEAQRSELALATRARLPDFDVSAGYSSRSGFGDFFDVMVSAPIPIFSGRKQSQAIVEQNALLAEHEARHHALVYELESETASLYAELQRIRRQLVLLTEGILPQVRSGVHAASASYRVGRVDFAMLLDAQGDLYRHELDYHRLLADFAMKVADLERTVGAEVLP